MEKNAIRNDSSTPTYKAFMTTLFVGIMDAILCLIFNIVYRGNGAYFSSDLINVSSLIFGVLIIFSLIGIIYTVMVSTLEHGNIIFMFLFTLLTVLGLWGGGSVNYSTDPVESERFRGLLKGIIWIIGVSTVVGIPLLRSSKKFEEQVL
jgi:hypothetical protein